MTTCCEDDEFAFVLRDPYAVDLQEDDSASVALSLTDFMRGPKGDPGVKGDPGDRGPPGASGGSGFEYTQNVAATTWNIAHNLGRHPSVTVVDSAGTEVEGDLKYIDTNHVVLQFFYPFAGQAFLN